MNEFFKKYPAVLPWLIVLIIIVAVAVWPESKQSKYKKEVQRSKEDAFFAAQSIIRSGLKSPSSAKFGYISDCGLPIIDYQAGTWSVGCYVDAENSFGAMIRTNYQVVLRRDGERWYKVDSKTW